MVRMTDGVSAAVGKVSVYFCSYFAEHGAQKLYYEGHSTAQLVPGVQHMARG